jgi:hypothetical protein
VAPCSWIELQQWFALVATPNRLHQAHKPAGRTSAHEIDVQAKQPIAGQKWGMNMMAPAMDIMAKAPRTNCAITEVLQYMMRSYDLRTV